jgi:signal peptidase II
MVQFLNYDYIFRVLRLSTSRKIYTTTAITYLVALTFFSLDQYTKKLIVDSMPITVDVANRIAGGYPPYHFLPWLWFTHVVNFGAAFSTFYGQRVLLSMFAGIISLGIIAYERYSNYDRTKLLSFSLGFLLAGALGNLFDRLRMGYVTDFLDLRWIWSNVDPVVIMGKQVLGPFRLNENYWPIFNVADISINIGIGLLILYYLFQDKKAEVDPKDFEDDEIPNIGSGFKSSAEIKKADSEDDNFITASDKENPININDLDTGEENPSEKVL